MRKIYMLRKTTKYFDRYNKEGTTEYEKDLMTGEIIMEKRIEEAKGVMLSIEREISESGLYEKEYFWSSDSDRIHNSRYLELNVKGKPMKNGIDVRITITTIPFGQMLC